jgi:hypothetical protein
VNIIQKISNKSKRNLEVPNCWQLPAPPANDFGIPESIEIDFHRCKSEKTISFEEVREDLAADIFMQNGDKYKDNEVVLDIDEDFFGCTYASQIMFDAGITDDEIQSINKIIGHLFCPYNAKEEIATDNILIKFLDDIVSSGYVGHVMKESVCREKENSIFDKYMQILQNDHKHLLCRNTSKQEWNKKTFMLLLHSIMEKKLTQITAIKHVGFCSKKSKSHGIDITKSSEFSICIGANTPNRSIILEYHTNFYEIKQRTKILEDIFRTLKRRLLPSMITLSRSSRSGCAPRELQNLIEGNIIDSLKALSPIKLNYDTELLGGREGWLKFRGFWYI